MKLFKSFAFLVWENSELHLLAPAMDKCLQVSLNGLKIRASLLRIHTLQRLLPESAPSIFRKLTANVYDVRSRYPRSQLCRPYTERRKLSHAKLHELDAGTFAHHYTYRTSYMGKLEHPEWCRYDVFGMSLGFTGTWRNAFCRSTFEKIFLLYWPCGEG